MTTRTSPNEIRGILATSADDSAITAWIEIASLIIDSYASQCSRASASVLIKLEQLMTAHLMTTAVERSASIKSRSFGDSSESYGFTGGDGIKATPYGQQMLMLDPCGILVTMGMPSARSVLL